MAEIKSTLELALERTKKMAISEKEKEEIKHREVMQKATGLFHRHMEGYLSLNELLTQVEKMDDKNGSIAKLILLSRWVDALSLSDENEKPLKGIESLKGPAVKGIIEELRVLSSQYRHKMEKAKEEIKIGLTEELKRAKIYGSAVEPNVEGSEIWEKRIGDMKIPYHIKLEKIKDQLKTL